MPPQITRKEIWKVLFDSPHEFVDVCVRYIQIAEFAPLEIQIVGVCQLAVFRSVLMMEFNPLAEEPGVLPDYVEQLA